MEYSHVAARYGLPAILLLLVAHAGYCLIVGIDHPIVDLYAFRQTQTAISAYWLWNGGPWIAYETPVLGAPWTVPFEFPLYQGIVALLRSIGVPIDIGGRLVSFAFFLACLMPLRSLFATLGLSRIAFLATSCLYLASPLYVFWARTVMIESTVLFLSLFWLALLAVFIKRGTLSHGGGAVVVGALAMMVKGSTFPGFALLGGLLTFAETWRAWRTGELRSFMPRLLGSAVIAAISIAAGFGWLVYSDKVKTASELGTLLATPQLIDWYFGGSDIGRWSLDLWRDIVARRIGLDTFGYGLVLVPAIVLSLALTRRHVPAIAALVAAFLLPLLLFTNLHVIHTYYQVANAIFLIAAAGIIIADLDAAGWRGAAVAGLAALVAGQLVYLHRRYVPTIVADYGPNHQTVVAGRLARQHIPPGMSALLLGDDFSATIPYYSERKTLGVPGMTPTTLMRRILDNPQSFLGEATLGGVIYCPGGRVYYDETPTLNPAFSGRLALVDSFRAGRKLLAEVGHNAGGCQILSPDREK